MSELVTVQTAIRRSQARLWRVYNIVLGKGNVDATASLICHVLRHVDTNYFIRPAVKGATSSLRNENVNTNYIRSICVSPLARQERPSSVPRAAHRRGQGGLTQAQHLWHEALPLLEFGWCVGVGVGVCV